MADVQISTNESQEDLLSFNDLLEQLNSDADDFVTEYLKRKLEDYVTILLVLHNQHLLLSSWD